MAAAVLIQDGKSLTVTLAGAVTKGDVWEGGAEAIGIYLETGVTGDIVEVAMEGVWQLDKETGVAFTQGDRLYWDTTNDNLDKTATNVVAGLCWEDAASGATSAKVKLNAGGGG